MGQRRGVLVVVVPAAVVRAEKRHRRCSVGSR